METLKNHTDIITRGWVGKMPQSIRPYLYLMRLDRPIGTWLLLLPAFWAVLLTGGMDAWSVMGLFSVGAIIMRGAGCVVNDIWDRNLDGQVERTEMRPIPNGDVTVKKALFFVLCLLCLGFLILVQFNILTIGIGAVSLIFVGAYPLMKRWTWWPQAFLGLTFNFGALMGWCAMTGELPWQAWALYASGFFWTLGYDTIYAMQDREDDALVGIKSTARLFTDRLSIDPRVPCFMFYLIHYALLMMVIFDGVIIDWVALCALIPFVHLMWQVKTLSMTDPQNALDRFKSNCHYGLMVCGVILFLS
ncbi:MAG: 4-hydroxybenzoate octaprenyltransferase [Alphaproteobacteria bacterium]|nr:MAG: 4-hydroxybenzoate octaprenyltransferase [Alphaproteobacteria bacterium]